MDINKVILIGRLTRDPEIRTLPNGTGIAKFSLAVNRRYTANNEAKEEVSFFDCVVWGKMAEVVRQYCQKGKQVAVDGRLRQNRWQDNQTGQSRSKVEIVVDSFQLLGRASASAEGQNFSQSQSEETSIENREPVADESSNPEPPDMLDDDIPF